MENVFDVLCSALAEPEIKKQFLDSEGVDLMVLMMKYVQSFLHTVTHTHRSPGTKCKHARERSRSSTTRCQALLVQLHARHSLRH